VLMNVASHPQHYLRSRADVGQAARCRVPHALWLALFHFYCGQRSGGFAVRVVRLLCVLGFCGRAGD